MTNPGSENWHQRASELEALGLTWLEQGRYDDAARLLLDALALYEAHDDDSGALPVATYLGVALYENGKLDQAVAIWEEVLARGWKLPTVYALLERHYDRQGSNDAAARIREAARQVSEEAALSTAERVAARIAAPGEELGKRVLLADDEADVRELMARYLGSLGYEVEGAADGVAAFDLIAENPPDLVVLDVYMPKMTGLDVLLKMREEAIDTPVIVISGFPKAELVDTIVEHGGVFLSKPVSLQELRRLVEAKLALVGVGAG